MARKKTTNPKLRTAQVIARQLADFKAGALDKPTASAPDPEGAASPPAAPGAFCVLTMGAAETVVAYNALYYYFQMLSVQDADNGQTLKITAATMAELKPAAMLAAKAFAKQQSAKDSTPPAV